MQLFNILTSSFFLLHLAIASPAAKPDIGILANR